MFLFSSRQGRLVWGGGLTWAAEGGGLTRPPTSQDLQELWGEAGALGGSSRGEGGNSVCISYILIYKCVNSCVFFCICP